MQFWRFSVVSIGTRSGTFRRVSEEAPMNNGKTLFAQLMDFLPWSTFTRIVARYRGDQRVRTLSCAEHYRAMAFAQLTYRESLRDIETCLSVQASKLYSMGFRDPVRRSTLADANETRDWRIYAELAQRLIVQARRLYVNEDLGLDLANTVYALDSTSGGQGAHAVGLARQHPELHPRVGWQAARRSRARPAAPGGGRDLRHGSGLCRFRPAPCAAPGRSLLRHPRQIEHGCSSGLFRRHRPHDR